MLSKLYNRYTKKPLRLYWWKYEPPHKLNFGDEITPYLIEKLWGRRCVWAPPGECELAGAGSVIEILQKKAGNNHVQVWGSGFIQEGPDNTHSNLSFHAVRGELSKSRVGGKVATGDPALLIPLVTGAVKKKYRFGIVPHYVDKGDLSIIKLLNQLPSSQIIDVLEPPEKVVEKISSCDLILSSSLHGIIVADAYGIPNIQLDLSDKITGSGYKFRDYATSVNRKVTTLNTDEVKNLKNYTTLEDKSSTANRNTISNLQSSLLDSFPH